MEWGKCFVEKESEGGHRRKLGWRRGSRLAEAEGLFKTRAQWESSQVLVGLSTGKQVTLLYKNLSASLLHNEGH